MSSESGLKQRKPVNPLESRHGDSKNSDSYQNQSDSGKEENNDEYDADSKETRLTLMEEILLLGLKDREVTKNKILEFFFLTLLSGIYVILE